MYLHIVCSILYTQLLWYHTQTSTVPLCVTRFLLLHITGDTTVTAVSYICTVTVVPLSHSCCISHCGPFFLLLYMTGDTKGTAVLYSYCSIKHTVTSPQWTVCYCYTSLKMQRFWLVLLPLHTMLGLLHLHTIYTPRLHIKAHISDVNSFVSLQFTSQSFVAVNPSLHPQRWMIRMQFHALCEACDV